MRTRRAPVLAVSLIALALEACVIGPKPEDPAEDKTMDAAVSDTSLGTDTLVTNPEAGVVSEVGDAGGGGDAGEVGDAGDADGDTREVGDASTDADGGEAATDAL